MNNAGLHITLVLLAIGLLGCSGSKEITETSSIAADTAVADTTNMSKEEILETKRVSVLEMKSQIDILQDEIGNLKSEIEGLKKENTTLQRRLREEYGSTDIPINGSAQDTKIDSLSDTYRELLITRNLQSAENAVIAAEIRRSDTLFSKDSDLSGLLDPISLEEYRERYNQALNQYFRGNYYRAIAEFQTLLIIDKTNEYADNAQYWIAESYYSMGDYEKAVKEFDRVLTFDQTNKGDHAQFKKALCQLKLGNRYAAKNAFDQLRQKYPESELLPRVSEYMEDPSYHVQ